MGNGFRPGREPRKPAGWMKPGERKRTEMAAASQHAEQKPQQPQCTRCRGMGFVQHDENFLRCRNCDRKVFVRNRQES